MNCVDIFSGCGGLTRGLYKAGVRGFFAIGKSVDAFMIFGYVLCLFSTTQGAGIKYRWKLTRRLSNHGH